MNFSKHELLGRLIESDHELALRYEQDMARGVALLVERLSELQTSPGDAWKMPTK